MVKSKPKHSRKSAVLALIILILLITIGTVHAASKDLSRIESTKQSEMNNVPSNKKEAVKSPENKAPVTATEVAATPAITPTPVTEPTPAPVVDPNGCEAKGMWYRADNNECIPKATEVAALSSTDSAQTYSTGSGDCATEIAKYDWDQTIAYRVMMMESSNNPGILNNNPNTGDYSVGCFQINLYGANALSRPSESALKVASINVAFAYQLWLGSGSFISNWTNTCAKVGC